MKLLSAALFAAALSALPAAAQPAFTPGSTMARLSKADPLRIGVKFDQPLFGQRNLSGQPIGFDVQIAELVASKLGVPQSRIRFVETASSNREPFLEQGKVDFIVATYAINARRRKVVTFAGPYIVGGQDLMVKKGNPLGIKGPEDLAGHKACVINGSEGQAVLVRKYPKAQIVPFDVISKCVEALKNGSIDAVVTTDLIEAGLVSKSPATLELVGAPFTVEPWGIGMPKTEADFCRFVNKVLTDAEKDGTYAKIYDATLKPYLKKEKHLPPLDPCP